MRKWRRWISRARGPAWRRIGPEVRRRLHRERRASPPMEPTERDESGTDEEVGGAFGGDGTLVGENLEGVDGDRGRRLIEPADPDCRERCRADKSDKFDIARGGDGREV